IRLQQDEPTANSVADQLRITIDVQRANEGGAVFLHGERDRDLVRPSPRHGRVDLRFPEAVLPEEQANAQHVATQLAAVEVMLVFERRRVAREAERLDYDASAF